VALKRAYFYFKLVMVLDGTGECGPDGGGSNQEALECCHATSPAGEEK